MDTKETKNEKIAHSYFQLSQIFAIFVGGLLITTGLFFPKISFREFGAYSQNLCNGAINVSLCETLIHNQINVSHAFSGFFFLIAILFGINSFILWMWGDLFIRGVKTNDIQNRRSLIIFNAFIILILILLRIISYLEFSGT